MALSPSRLGRIGEQIAVRHLESVGLHVVARNWRCAVDGRRGEVDVVAVEDDVVVIVEVKTRRCATPAGPLEAITPAKLARLRRLAVAWSSDHPVPRRLRIDAVSVWWPDGGGGAVVEHIRGVDA